MSKWFFCSMHCLSICRVSADNRFRRRAFLPRQNSAGHRRFGRRRRQRHRRALDDASFAAPYSRQPDHHRRKYARRRRDHRHELRLWQSQTGRTHRAVCHRHADQSVDRVARHRVRRHEDADHRRQLRIRRRVHQNRQDRREIGARSVEPESAHRHRRLRLRFDQRRVDAGGDESARRKESDLRHRLRRRRPDPSRLRARRSEFHPRDRRRHIALGAALGARRLDVDSLPGRFSRRQRQRRQRSGVERARHRRAVDR